MSGTLPTWLESLLGIDPSGSGEGTSWRLTRALPWAPWVTLLLVIAAIAWVAYFYARESPNVSGWLRGLLAAVRLTAIGLIMFVMLAEVVVQFQRTELPFVVVVVDTSASMDLADRYNDKQLLAELQRRVQAVGLERITRINLAKTLLLEEDGQLFDEIQRRYKLKVYFADSVAKPQTGTADDISEAIRTIEADGPASRLGAAVRTVLSDLRGTPPAAIVLLTDGITTEGETISEAAGYARRKNVPLLTIGLGSEKPARNLKLSDLLVDEVVFVDDVVRFEATVTAAGFSGQSVEVLLRKESGPEVLARRQVTLSADGQPQKVSVTYRPTRVGEFDYVVEIKPHSDEISRADNRVKQTVSVRKEQIRVLLVQSYPNYEFRYLKSMLERDNTIQLSSVLQEADLEYAELDKSALRLFPVNRDELFKYDTIIFGDVDRAFLSTVVLQNIADFVEIKGGGIVFIGGPRYTPSAYANTPLADLMPVDVASVRVPPPGESQSEGFLMRPTEMGVASPMMQLGDSRSETADIWSNLAPLYWMLHAANLKPAARTLAVHPTRLGSDGPLPLICMQYVGAGKVMMHMTDETWRWRYRVGDVFFARYWVQTIRYLSRSKLLGKDRDIELTVDPPTVKRGESVRLRARFFDERRAPSEDSGVTIVVEQEGRTNRRITLHRNASSRGVFEGVFSRPAEGRYHLWIAVPALEGKAPSADFVVEAPPGERERTEMDLADLKRAAKLTGGRFYRFDECEELLDDLPEGRLIPMDPLPPISIWDKWWVLLPFLLLLSTEWLLRKMKGMA